MKRSERAWCPPPRFALVSPQLSSFLSSHPCSSFLPFDVPPLLCSRVRTAYRVEVTSPHPTIRCNYKVTLFPNPCSGVR